MASWMIHLRVADTLLDRVPDLAANEFLMGNLAPDSGVPNADGTAYTPGKDVSHYKARGTDGKNRICVETFATDYFTKDKQAAYDKQHHSFYLGYLVHLSPMSYGWTRC